MSKEVQIAAVLVIYNTKILDCDSYKTLLASVDFPILIYDNSPNSQEFPSKPNITYRNNPSNPGVSKAYNEAAKWAKALSCSHLLLLDSDSLFPENAIQEYLRVAQESVNALLLPEMKSGNHKISPFYFNYGKSHYGDNIFFGEINLGKIVAINSGTLIPIRLFDEAGGFNEKLPLDWSDVHFYRKLKKFKPKVIHISLTVNHGLSEHSNRDLTSAKYRFRVQLKGIKHVSTNFGERLLMLFWIKLKALKLCFHYKTPWFILHYSRYFYA